MTYMTLCMFYAYTTLSKKWSIDYLSTCLFLCRFLSSLCSNYNYMTNIHTSYNDMFDTFSYQQFAMYYPIAIVIGIFCGLFRFHRYIHQLLGINSEESYDNDSDISEDEMSRSILNA